MSEYTIQDFWIPRLGTLTLGQSASLIDGWSFQDRGLDTFMEAPLSPNDIEFGDEGNPRSSPILLVSAPGAMGKSTLARQIAYQTNSIYIDLAAAEPVGANTLSGGLVRSKAYDNWSAGSTTVLIDALDEARLRVTQEAFQAFLSDLAQLSENRRIPTVLFGRTGAVQEAWLILRENNADVSVLEIGYYGPDESVDFAEAILQVSRRSRPHASVERQALQLLLQRLREQTENDGDRFAGYAPVLLAVAKRVEQEGNPSSLVAQIKRGEQPVTLQTVVADILKRERGKLKGLPFEDSNLTSTLYSPEEQLDRLIARIYKVPAPELPKMSSADAQTYAHALDTWVEEHPFLGGSDSTSSAVFEAYISAKALKSAASAAMSLRTELSKGAAANPFLYSFYIGDEEDSGTPVIQSEHIGVVYASLRAGLSLGDAASLLVEGFEDGEEEQALQAEVEITLERHDTERQRVLRFQTEQVGAVCLGTHVENVDVVVPFSQVEVGPGNEAIFVAPINIQCEKLSILTDKVIAESSPGLTATAIMLEAMEFDGAQMLSVPILRGDARLFASWPDAFQFPWTSFATEPPAPDDPRIEEALRRVRKFVFAFRSHGKGRLARIRDKIEHARMTKGTGKAVLSLMVEEEILSLEQPRYFLDPNRLVELTGTTYDDWIAYRYSPRAVDFVKRALLNADQ